MFTAQTLLAQDGNWQIEQAQLRDGKSYNGSLTISKVGQAFGVDWKTTAGNYSGLGLLADAKLFVGIGRWAMGGGRQFGTENITR